MRPSARSLLQTTAVSIATILGTGILGLPVSLHASGLYPFLLTFSVNLAAQIGVVIATTDLLQAAYVVSANSGSCRSPSASYSALPTDDVPLRNEAAPPPAPSLHTLADYFLPNAVLRGVFNCIVMLHFLCVLSAYALAGPQAFTSLIPALRIVPQWLRIALFVVLCACVVLLLHQVLIAPLTLGTAVKALLLSVLVVIILLRGILIRQHVDNDWALPVLVDPFLMGTFALNGVVNLMPVTFEACLKNVRQVYGDPLQLDASFIRAYRYATILGVFVCYVLNVAWCVGILLCVPQGSAVVRVADVVMSAFVQRHSGGAPCQGESATLECASEEGLISTIPLINVLKQRHDRLDGIIALLANVFIALSVAISFLVMSLGMKHYIDDTAPKLSERAARASRWVKYLLSYGVVLGLAVGNPKALIKIMEGVTTMALNMEAGVFVLYMLYVSRFVSPDIPVPLSRVHAVLVIGCVGFYFVFAVLVDAIFFLPKSFT